LVKLMIESKAKAIEIARLVASKKAGNITILDIRNSSSLCDYFVICSGETTTQVNAIYETIMRKFKKDRSLIHHCEKDESRRWILIDFFDVILHIFDEEMRRYYNLEYVWTSAPKIKFLNKEKFKKSSLTA